MTNPIPNPTATLCRCGRRLDAPHCAACGSAVCYVNIRENRIDKQSGAVVRAFRCRRCGQLFFEDSPCAAPLKKVGSTLRSKSPVQKEAEKVLQNRNVPLTQQLIYLGAALRMPFKFLEDGPEKWNFTEEQWEQIRQKARDLDAASHQDAASHSEDVESGNTSDEERAAGNYKEEFFK